MVALPQISALVVIAVIAVLQAYRLSHIVGNMVCLVQEVEMTRHSDSDGSFGRQESKVKPREGNAHVQSI